VSHAECVSRGRNYETDLATCREIAEGSSASGSSKELAGTGAGALVGASAGLLAGRHIGTVALLGVAGAGVGAVAGTALSHADVRARHQPCLQARSWTVLGAE
jgi:hypothetical protein